MGKRKKAEWEGGNCFDDPTLLYRAVFFFVIFGTSDTTVYQGCGYIHQYWNLDTCVWFSCSFTWIIYTPHFLFSFISCFDVVAVFINAGNVCLISDSVTWIIYRESHPFFFFRLCHFICKYMKQQSTSGIVVE